MPTKKTAEIKPEVSGSAIFNAVKNELGATLKDVPYMTADNTREIYGFFSNYPLLYNTFVNALVNKIGKTILTSRLYTNPMSVFIKGEVGLGETIEDIFISLQEPHVYDMQYAQKNVDYYEKPDIKVAYYIMNSQLYYKVTRSPAQIKEAFRSEDDFRAFLEAIVTALYTSAYYDEFNIMKYMIAVQALKGNIGVVTISDSATAEEQMEVIKATSNSLQFMNTENNYAGVPNYSDVSSQYLILTSDFEAKMSVQVLANAFNLSYADYVGSRVMVDSFANLPMTRIRKMFTSAEGVLDPNFYDITVSDLEQLSQIKGLMVDINYFQIYYDLFSMYARENEEGLFTNYWLHKWTYYAVSPFAPARLFTSGTPTLTALTVSPPTYQSYPGNRVAFSVTAEGNGFASAKVNWSCTEGAEITDSGLLMIQPDATGTITVTAASVENPSITSTAAVTILK